MNTAANFSCILQLDFLFSCIYRSDFFLTFIPLTILAIFGKLFYQYIWSIIKNSLVANLLPPEHFRECFPNRIKQFLHNLTDNFDCK